MRPNYPLGLALQQKLNEPITGLFQRINRMIPEDQQLLILPNDTSVRQALERLKQTRFSQVPISDGREIIGVFSYRSFSLGALRFEDDWTDVLGLTVADFLEDLPFRSVNDLFENIIDDLEEHDAILVGSVGDITAIVTAMDILRYLYGVTSPYVLVAEIELAIRALMSWSASAIELQGCLKKTLSGLYDPARLPTRVEDLTFSDYASVIGYGDNWNSFFRETFGSTRPDVRAKLERVSEIRNYLFHFRREITVDEFEELTLVRDWLLRRSKLTQNRPPKTNPEVA
jgi:CBS domain-containing protein